ncbi:hypothetical protein HYDPIDRAFT_190512 [Hydnomerulius pinastri MD-312]|uniref:AB hydrolase-1 domain-containing protein n=1 Tax=Hydnomerulius pinastri MD-312 TaxID=994086 RepID=A0A0C9W0K7_9AGAM|nr:hypothetical protein HYDPIDRAFT_190512 [Hydnomerulius pinastri MD-312]
MLQRQIILKPDAKYPLHITAKQYWLPEFNANWEDPDALTLIVLHSTSFHKETWEPALEHLFSAILKHPSSSSRLKVRSLNDAALQQPPFYRNFGCEKYAEAVHRFMSSGSKLSTPVDFRSQKLLGLGHSLGGVAISILPTVEPLFEFSAIILVEPMLSPGGPETVQDLKLFLIKGAYERRDVWPSREHASEYLHSRKRTERWDPRVLGLYVKYGLRVHPAAQDESAPYHGVTLACSRNEEVTMYRDPTGSAKGLEALNSICTHIPVSVIFGDDSDYMPLQDALIDQGSGRQFQDVTRIKGAGHLVPQQVPEKLSEVLLGMLCRHTNPTAVCKL